MRDFVKADGSFSDRFYQGILQYRNSPQHDVRLSPAQIVFGRQIKDFLPVMGYKYEPWQEWCLIRNEREKALSKRYEVDGKRLAEYTRDFKEVPLGLMLQYRIKMVKMRKNGIKLERWLLLLFITTFILKWMAVID